MNIFSAKQILSRNLGSWFLSACIVVAVAACSSPKSTTVQKTVPRQDAKVVFPIQHQATPAHVGYVNDHEDLFSPEQIKSLDSLARNFERSNLIAIKVLTISDPAVTLENFDATNKTALQNWKTQHGNSEKCMTISISKHLHRIRIDFGSFVSKLLSDQEAKAIIDNQFTPFYKEDQYFLGTTEGLKAIMDTIRSNIKF